MPLSNPTDLASPAAIGSITPNTVAATTINASAAIASTSSTTGTIVVPNGGVGIGGSLFVGGGVNAISAALRSGSFTSTIVPTTLSANQNITLPNQSGTIALLTDIAAATGVQKLFVSNVASAVTGTLVETTLATFTIPVTLGANSCLDIELFLQTAATNNAKTFRVKIGSDIVFSVNVQNTATAVHRRTLRCQNSTSSQVIFASATASTGNSGSSPSTFAIDFTQSQTVTITAQLALATDTATLRGATFLLY